MNGRTSKFHQKKQPIKSKDKKVSAEYAEKLKEEIKNLKTENGKSKELLLGEIEKNIKTEAYYSKISSIGEQLQSLYNDMLSLHETTESFSRTIIDTVVAGAVKWEALTKIKTVNGLSKMWDAPPDISSAFGISPTTQMDPPSVKEEIESINNAADNCVKSNFSPHDSSLLDVKDLGKHLTELELKEIESFKAKLWEHPTVSEIDIKKELKEIENFNEGKKNKKLLEKIPKINVKRPSSVPNPAHTLKRNEISMEESKVLLKAIDGHNLGPGFGNIHEIEHLFGKKAPSLPILREEDHTRIVSKCKKPTL